MSSKKTSRRNFLFGRSLLGTIRHAAENAAKRSGLLGDCFPEILAGSRQDWPLLKVSRTAMGGEFELSLNKGQFPDEINAAMTALDEIERLENIFSFFKPESELSQLNLLAHDEPFPLSEEMCDILAISLDLARETEGAFDITASPLWELWGFARKKGKIPENHQIARTLTSVGMNHLRFDDQLHQLTLSHPKTEISFGAIGKGYALDRAAKELDMLGITDYLFHGGMSSVLVRGERWGSSKASSSEDKRGWPIGIADPLHPGHRLAEIRLCDEALATSGSQKQFFLHQGKRYSHILDPRTGYPAEEVFMVTVTAPTATLADALSTAFFVLGPDQTEQYCRTHPDVAALLVVPSKEDNQYELCVFGFDETKIHFLS